MNFGTIGPETIAIFIPIMAVLGGVLIAIAAIIVGGRTKDLEHRERIIAMEKGIALPEPTEPVRKPVYSARRAAGLVMTGIGLAVTMGIWASEGFEGGVWGFIPLFFGIGLLIAAHLDKREYDKAKRESTQSTYSAQP